MPGTATRSLPLACASAVLIGCTESETRPVEPTNQLAPVTAEAHGPPNNRRLYLVRLDAVEPNRSRGTLLIEVAERHLSVWVHATGLEPGHPIPQHIHQFSTCAEGGPVILNLDAGLTVPGEGEPVGAAYPTANHRGVVRYHASRSLRDLRAAVNTHVFAGEERLKSAKDVLDWLDLNKRNAHMHVAFGPPFPAVNCGEVRRFN